VKAVLEDNFSTGAQHSRPDGHRKLTVNPAIESIMPALLRSVGSAGVYARTNLFERVNEGLSLLISQYREPGTEVLCFPPVMSRQLLETSGYLKSFPHLLGCVSCLDGDEMEIREAVENDGWVANLKASELVLAPAACYPVYALQAEVGQLPKEGRLFDVSADCFRHEATSEPGRLQSFRMREYVCLGTPTQVLEFRAHWLTRAEQLVESLKLPYKVAPASDPFFGRGGQLAASLQMEQSLKFEMIIPIGSSPTACMSFNYHLDHFGSTWSLRSAEGAIAHTSCVAFGMDRLSLALFANHGIDLHLWPRSVRENLALG
jgi:seryl-tRNA synthetase